MAVPRDLQGGDNQDGWSVWRGEYSNDRNDKLKSEVITGWVANAPGESAFAQRSKVVWAGSGVPPGTSRKVLRMRRPTDEWPSVHGECQKAMGRFGSIALCKHREKTQREREQGVRGKHRRRNK
jgi:hypothetical protein